VTTGFISRSSSNSNLLCRTVVTTVAVRYSSNVDASQYTVNTGGMYYWKKKTDDVQTSEIQVYINGQKATETKQLYPNPATRVPKRNDYGMRATAARYWMSMGTNTP
jgi:hypothetical protein